MVRFTPYLCNRSIPALELTLLVIYYPERLTPQKCQHRYFYPFVMALPMFILRLFWGFLFGNLLSYNSETAVNARLSKFPQY